MGKETNIAEQEIWANLAIGAAIVRQLLKIFDLAIETAEMYYRREVKQPIAIFLAEKLALKSRRRYGRISG